MNGLFSKTWETNFDGGIVPAWLTLNAGVIASESTAGWGGITLKRESSTGDKVLSAPAITDARLTGLEMECVFTGLDASHGSLEIGFLSGADGCFVKASGPGVYVVTRKGGVETQRYCYIRLSDPSIIYPLKIKWDIKGKTVQVSKGDGAVYIYFDNLDAGLTGTQPMLAWRNAPVNNVDTLISLSLTKHFL
uniref:hypothetical protein n=1 Tax=Pluralibacter gergoviae TaxID=61647 RepID=UPI00111441EF|nr:hypothetical protein [Pluralibacter gergoviae]